jgi:spore coat protein U-like protein
MFKKSILHLSVAAALLSASGIILAATATANIGISATVSKACSISSTTPVAFGIYDPIGTNATAPLNATGSISVTCSKGATGMTIGLSNGASAVAGQRTMKLTGGTATDLLNYTLGQPPSSVPATACTFASNIPWTTTAMMTLATGAGKTPQVYNVCGVIAAGQDVPAGDYTDTVVATLNF